MKPRYKLYSWIIIFIMWLICYLIEEHFNYNNAVIGILQFIILIICGMIALIATSALEE